MLIAFILAIMFKMFGLFLHLKTINTRRAAGFGPLKMTSALRCCVTTVYMTPIASTHSVYAKWTNPGAQKQLRTLHLIRSITGLLSSGVCWVQDGQIWIIPGGRTLLWMLFLVPIMYILCHVSVSGGLNLDINTGCQTK